MRTFDSPTQDRSETMAAAVNKYEEAMRRTGGPREKVVRG